MTNFLPLVEQYHSLQGEGYHAGKSAFFVRLAGCKVGCSWCDTKNSWDEKKYPSISIEKIINNNESGLILLKLVEIIGEKELGELNSETLNYIIEIMNRTKLISLRNELLLEILPLKV